MSFPELSRFADYGFLLLRLMVALVFITSGWSHLRNAEARSKEIGMSKGFTLFLGAGEFLGGLGVGFGVLTQLAALGLILIMLGAIQKKIFVWHSGFWGKGSQGWHYDLMLVIMNLVIIFTGGGRFVLLK
jgi:putative oxidoreductase